MNNQVKDWEKEEYEVKPNRFAIRILYVLLVTIGLCEILNELDIFHVGKDIMRFGALSSFMIMLLPAVMINNRRFCAHYLSKYLILGSLLLATFIVSMMLNFHASLCLFVPLLVGMQYPNRKIWSVAFIASIIIAFVSPLVSYIARTWDYQFLGFLHQMVQPDVAFTTATYTANPVHFADVILYLSLPDAVILLGYGYLMDNFNKTVISNVQNKRDLLSISETDALTGLGNRTSYELHFPDIPSECLRSISCVYVDANGLHELNNSKGHKAGDSFLKSVAEGMRIAFGSEYVYRIGGDEFVAFIKDRDENEVQAAIDLFKRMVENEHYSVSVGTITSNDLMCDMETLIARAETAMYTDKRNHYDNLRKPSWEKEL